MTHASPTPASPFQRLAAILRRAAAPVAAAAAIAFAPGASAAAAEEETLRTESPVITPLTPEQLAVDRIRVAAVQITGNWFFGAPLPPTDTPADKLLPYIERAAADGADMVVFPELYLGLLPVPHPETDKLAAAAREHGIYVVVGLFEIVNDEGEYANSTIIIDRQGEVVGRFFKNYQAVGGPGGWPPNVDCPEWLAFAGEEVPVFDLDFGRVGILTCYDGYFPELWRQLSLKGAEVILWPNARHGSVEDFIVRTHMMANYNHIIATNKAFGAGTMIAHWPNRIVAISEEAEEDYLVADLHFGHLRAARMRAREFHQRRAHLHESLARDWPVWEYYGETRESLEMVAPDRALSDPIRRRILEQSGVAPWQSGEPGGK